MHNSFGTNGLGAEQLFVMRMLQMSSRRTALVEKRAEHAINPINDPFLPTKPSSAAAASDENVKSATGAENSSIVMGTVLLQRGETVPSGAAYNVHHSNMSTTAARSHVPPPLSVVAVPGSSGESPEKLAPSALADASAKKRGVEAQPGVLLSPSSASSAATAGAAKDTEPVSPQSPQSPMRRMFELKGARPVRRPRMHDVITPHRRSDSDSVSVGNSTSSIGASGAGSRGSRADAAKAALQQQVVRRTLSSLGLPASADVNVAQHQQQQQRRRTAATPDGEDGEGEERLAETAAESPTGRGACSAFTAEDTVNTGEDNAFTPTAPNVSPKRGDNQEVLAVPSGALKGGGSIHPPVLNNSSNRNGASTPINVNVSAATPPAAATAAMPPSTSAQTGLTNTTTDSSSNSDAPTSPDKAQTFSGFVQRLCPVIAPPLSANAAAAAPNPLSYDTDVHPLPYTAHVAPSCGSAAVSTTSSTAATPSHRFVADTGAPPRWGAHMDYAAPLPDTELFSASAATAAASIGGASLSSSSCPSERSMNASMTSLVQPPFFPPPPPPYTAAPLPRVSFGAGTFTTAQDLVAHVRLARRWSIVATRRWYHHHSRQEEGASELLSNNTADLQQQQQRQLSTLMGRKRQGNGKNSNNSNSNSASGTGAMSKGLAAAAAMCAPLLLDGEASLVSDRVDAVLPTWAYLAAHTADAAPATLVSSLMGPVAGPGSAADPAASSMSSATASHYTTKYSHSRSLSSSATSLGGGLNSNNNNNSNSNGTGNAVPMFGAEDWVGDERLDRQSCLFPYELAEACALGRLRRKALQFENQARLSPGTSASTTTTTTCTTSLHLLRLECLLDVLQIPPTVRSLSALERQALLERALEEFTETGVLPTTVLRSVLNDAALRLLSSVDDNVLRRIAGDPILHCASNNDDGGDGDGAAGSADVNAVRASARAAADAVEKDAAEVVPLSLHVHTVQGDLSSSTTSSPTIAPQQPPRSLTTGSGQSAANSTVSGDMDSQWPRSVTAAPATPTQLIIAMLVHVTVAAGGSGSGGGRAGSGEEAETLTESVTAALAKVETAGEEAAGESVLGSEDAGRDGARLTAAETSRQPPSAEVTEATALDIAAVVIPHLFPPAFALSRYATRLSLSTAVDYDAIHAAGQRSEEGDAADAPTSASTTPTPWTWVDVRLSELRAACGVPEPKWSRQGGAGGCGDLDSLASSTLPHAKSRTRRSKKKTAAGMGASTTAAADVAASADQQETKEEEQQQQPHQEKETTAQQADVPGVGKAVAEEMEVESVEPAGVSEAQLRWDAVKETAELTARATAMCHALERICGHAQLLRHFARSLELEMREKEEAEEEQQQQQQQGRNKGTKTRRGQAKEAAKQKAAAAAQAATAALPASYTEEMSSSTRDLLARAALLLTNATLQSPASTAAPADSTPGSVDDKSNTSTAAIAALHRFVASWFTPFADHLSTEACSPLEQLESCILESSSSCYSSTPTSPANPSDEATTTTTSTTAAATTGSSGGVVDGAAGRHIVGAQVVVKETRRQRRSAAAARQIGDGDKDGAADVAALTANDAAASSGAVGAAASLLPALTLTRTMVHVCQRMAHHAQADIEPATAAPLLSLDRASSSPSPTAVRVLASSGNAQSLQEHVTRVHDVLCRVEARLASSQRRWAALQDSLEPLKEEWTRTLAVLSDEATARQALARAAEAHRVAAEQQTAARLKEEEEEKERMRAATAAAVAAEMKRAAAAEEAEAAREAAPLASSLPTSDDVRAIEAVAAAAAVAKEATAEGDTDHPRDVAEQAELESNEDGSESGGADGDEEATDTLASGSTRSTTPAAESTAAPAPSKRAGRPPLSIHTTDAAPPHGAAGDSASPHSNRNNSKGGGSSRSSTAASVAAGEVKKLRNRNANKSNNKQQAPSSRQSTARASAAGSPLASTAAGGSSFASSAPVVGGNSANASPAAAPGSTTATAGGTSSGNNNGGQLVRQAPHDALRGILALHIDATLVRQAAPFMAVGTLLFLIFILL